MEWKETIQLTNGIKSNNLYLNQSIILLSISNANSIRILFVNNEMYVFHFKHWFYFSTTLSTNFVVEPVWNEKILEIFKLAIVRSGHG